MSPPRTASAPRKAHRHAVPVGGGLESTDELRAKLGCGFVWAPRLLLRNRVAVRDIVPGAIFTMLGLVGMRIISGLLLKHWLEWYSKSYGALGIVMAIFFWLVFAATILVLAAALSPALAHRRDLRQARPADGEESASAE